MRIAVTGTHGVGRSTLIEDFCAGRTGFNAVLEPWWLLVEDVAALHQRPTVADLEEQLSRSCALILEADDRENMIFDRCPLDFLAYLNVVSGEEGFKWSPHGRLMASIDKALRALDLVVFVPLSQPDDIRASIEYPRLRRLVDARLTTMLRDDDLGLLETGLRVVTASGARDRRVASILAAL